MKLSVIIPSYNFSNYIESAMLSVFFQVTNFDFEVIIIDDCSTDSSYEKIKNLFWLKKTGDCYGCNVRIFRNEKNIGGFENYKQLHKLCNGEYISMLDGDDVWVDNYKLQRHVDFLDSNKNYIMCFDGYIRDEGNGVYTPNQVCSWLSNINPDVSEITTNDLLITNPICSSTKTYRNNKEFILNLFSKYSDEVKFFDWIINYNLSKFGPIKYMDTVSAIYRFHGNGLASSMTEEEKLIEINKIKLILLEDFNNFQNENNFN